MTTISTAPRSRVRKSPRRPKRRHHYFTPLFLISLILAGICVFHYTKQLRHFTRSSAHSSATSSNATQCIYHGNCPPNTACVDRVCLPFLLPHVPDVHPEKQVRHENCFKACLQELSMDEYYYRGMEPKVIRSFPSSGGHHGCVLQFERQRVTKKPPNLGSFQQWVDARLRRVVRVDLDPESSTNGSPKPTYLWNALCNLPCEDNSDCPPETECMGRQVQANATAFRIREEPKSCQRSFLSAQNQPKDMVIVTGANADFYSALRNFAASVKFWAPERKLVIYNLGMSSVQLKDIKMWTNVVALHWETGIPKTLPPHVHYLNNYAWKPIIINETVHKYKSIFWLDAGATFTGPVDAIEEIIHRNGLFLVRGQDDDMKALSHPDTYRALGYDRNTFRANLKSPHYAGGVQGHVFPSRFVDTIVVPNAMCAMDPNCIAPRGSSLFNHRFDQTSLSILAYQPTIQAPHYTEYLAGGREQLNSDLWEPSKKILWTSRGKCKFYASNVELTSNKVRKFEWQQRDWMHLVGLVE